MKNCQLKLRLSGGALQLLHRQPRSSHISDVATFENAPELAERATPAIKALMESIASSFRYSAEIEALRIELRFMDDMWAHADDEDHVPKVRWEILDLLFEPLTNMKTKHGFGIYCREPLVQGGHVHMK
jgi:hypothetical protein